MWLHLVFIVPILTLYFHICFCLVCAHVCLCVSGHSLSYTPFFTKKYSLCTGTCLSGSHRLCVCVCVSISLVCYNMLTHTYSFFLAACCLNKTTLSALSDAEWISCLLMVCLTVKCYQDRRFVSTGLLSVCVYNDHECLFKGPSRTDILIEFLKDQSDLLENTLILPRSRGDHFLGGIH